MSFPAPPKSNRLPKPPGWKEPEYVPPPPYKAPDTPVIENSFGKLTETETSMILRTTLLPEHREDPNVLRFISSYIQCRSTAQACREAGLKGSAGYHLRRRPDIHQAICKLTEKSVMKYGYDASEVIERVKEIAGLDPIEFENEDGTFKTSLHKIAPEARRAIKKFKAKNIYGTDPNGMRVVIGELIEVELWDKMKATELLGREKDIFKETKVHQHDVTTRMADVLLASGDRATKRLEAMKDVSPPPQIEGHVERDTDDTKD